MFRPTAEDRGVALDVTAEDGAPKVHCDGRLVHSALMDILSNALDACAEREYPEGETPRIDLRANLSESDSAFVVAIRDNGCGMTPEIQANVFTPFFSTKKKSGTGLGLALTARTIRLHGGEIDVESRLDEGTEFRIHLPLNGPEVEQEI